MSNQTAAQRPAHATARHGVEARTGSLLPSRFEALDSWRGICAVLVAVYHIRVTSHVFGTTVLQMSWMFVDFFFVLSGFVIMEAYGGRLRSGDEAWRFLLRRLGRVWPLHVAMLGVLLAFEVLKAVLEGRFGMQFLRPAFDERTSLASLGANLLLVHALGVLRYESWNTPSWSVSTEFYTYVVFALVAVALGRRFLWAAAALAVLCGALLVVASPGHLATGFDFTMVRCAYGFMLGCLANRLARRLAGWRGFGTVLEVAALAAVLLVLHTGITAWNVLAPVVFAFGAVVFAQERGLASRLLRTAPFLGLGRISYSIYMVHLPLLAVGFERFQRWVFANWGGGVVPYTDRNGLTFPVLDGPLLLGDAMIFVYLALVVAIAHLTYRYVEDPWRKRFGTWASSGTPGGRPPRTPDAGVP